MKSVTSIVYGKLRRKAALGLAYTETVFIEIDERLEGLELLYVLIHEIMHCQNPKWGELKIEGHSREMANLLYEQNFRKVDLK